jgi:hypothetical protein
MLSGMGFDARAFHDSAPMTQPLPASVRELAAVLPIIRVLSGDGGNPAATVISIGKADRGAILASVESGGLMAQIASRVAAVEQAVPSGPVLFGFGGVGKASNDLNPGVRSPFDGSRDTSAIHEILVQWGASHQQDGASSEGGPGPLARMLISSQIFQDFLRAGDMTFQRGPDGYPGPLAARNLGLEVEIPRILLPESVIEGGGTARGRSSISRNVLRDEFDDGSGPAVAPSPPIQAEAAEAALAASRGLTADGPLIGAEGGVGSEARAALEAMSPGEADSAGQSSVVEVESDFDLPAPIGSDLLLQAWSNNAASWDEALEELVGGVDELITGLVDFEGEAAYLPWAVGAGLALAASEAARKARPRPDPYLAYVDGSAVEPMPHT